MAIWQFNLSVIPKSSIIQRYGMVPQSLEINHAAWKNYWEIIRMQDFDAEPDFEDATTIKWWRDVTVDLVYIGKAIDQLLPRASYSTPQALQWKGDEKCDNDHDVWLGNDGQFISSFSFRSDLRDSKIDFLAGMIRICDELNCMLMDSAGNLLTPSLEAIAKVIPASAAARFLSDPDEYLKNLEK